MDLTLTCLHASHYYVHGPVAGKRMFELEKIQRQMLRLIDLKILGEAAFDFL